MADIQLEEVLARARSLCDDLDLHAVQQWKQAHPGALAVGYLPVYAPRPLFEALGCLPVAVFGGGDQVDIIRGDSYFQSYICHIPRSVIEIALAGKLDALDGMVFPSTCDVIRNLGGMWKILFPQRYGAYLDLPQNFTWEVGGRFYRGELLRIARELTERGARPLDDAALREALHADNQRRERLLRLRELRAAEPWRVPASEVYAVVRAGTLMTATDHARMLDSYLAGVLKRPTRALDTVKVVLVGAFCEQPPLDLIKALEKAGCDIVDDDLQHGLHAIDAPYDCSEPDPMTALARAWTEHGAAQASRFVRDGDKKGQALVAKVRACGADGVVFAAASFCDPALLDQPMLETALNQAGIPFTAFKFSENTGQFQVIREQAGAFSDAVKLWSSAA